MPLRHPESLWFGCPLLLRRLSGHRHAPGEIVSCTMPWGSTLHVQHDEFIGRKILEFGVFELSVCELIARLTDRGETALDIGANIGQMTSLMAACSGPQGRVWAFEPHPVVLERLRRNVAEWGPENGHATVEVKGVALGSEAGRAMLKEEPDFGPNLGKAGLVGTSAAKDAVVVEVERLDDVPEIKAPVGVMKIDVENFEFEVLKGAASLLERGVRDIVYEDHQGHPCKVSELLEPMGYSIFAVKRGLMGPELLPADVWFDDPKVATPNFLATLDPDRARARFRSRGYLSLRKILRS